jgi:hypothetical protein
MKVWIHTAQGTFTLALLAVRARCPSLPERTHAHAIVSNWLRTRTLSQRNQDLFALQRLANAVSCAPVVPALIVSVVLRAVSQGSLTLTAERALVRCAQRPATETLANENSTLTTLLEIELIDEDDIPVAHEPFEILLEPGGCVQGTLDANGRSVVRDVPHNARARVRFPQRDAADWHPL